MSVNDDSLKQIFALGRAAAPVLELPGGLSGVIIPDGYAIETFKDRYKLPEHIETCARFSKLESFIHYVNEFLIEGKTQIFANSDASVIRAIMNYHKDQKPDHASHIAEFRLPPSDEWTAWNHIDNRALGQADFAEFIEENRLNVVEPLGADLLEMVTDLQSKTTVEFQSNIKLHNGMAKLSYSENQETKGNGSFEVPAKLILGMPVFRYADNFKMEAFLRTRIKDGKAYFTIKLDKPNKVFLAAFNEICNTIQVQTSITVLHGSSQ